MTQMMKALVKEHNGPGITLKKVPLPKIGKEDVLIKIKKASICGTDLTIHKWNSWAQKNVSPGTTIGHEFVGVIEEIGSGVTRPLKKGMRVSAEGHITCGTCRNCSQGTPHLCPDTKVIGIHRNGCFTEYLSMPAKNIFPLPDTVDDRIACFFDAFGNAVHTSLTYPLIGQDVLITGAGPIGIMAAAIAKKAGAHKIVITDILDNRLNIAKNMGATLAVNIQKKSLDEAMKEINISGFTVGLEMSGNEQALNALLKNMVPGGNIALLGLLEPTITIDWDAVIFKMLNLKGIFGRRIFETWHQMVQLVESGLDLFPLITHEYALEDHEEAFKRMYDGSSGKIIFTIS